VLGLTVVASLIGAIALAMADQSTAEVLVALGLAARYASTGAASTARAWQDRIPASACNIGVTETGCRANRLAKFGATAMQLVIQFQIVPLDAGKTVGGSFIKLYRC